MLTRKQIKKTARLQQQVGELRPGYLKDGTANLEGPASGKHSSASLPRSNRRGKMKGKKAGISVVFSEDPETGEILVIQK